MQRPSEQILVLFWFTHTHTVKSFLLFCQGPLRECWTQWFDRDNPDGTGDWETLILLRKWYRGRICDDPIEIEATTLSGTPSAATGDVIFRLV